MDQKTIESIIFLIQHLKKDQKVIANKVIKLSDVFKATVDKHKKKNSQMFASYDAKLVRAEDQVAKIKVVVERNTIDVSKLEEEYNHANDLLKIIDENLKEIEVKIEASEKLIKKLEDERRAKKDEIENSIKLCLFDKRGYCKEKDGCKFFYAEQICEIYLENNVCWRDNCRKRHPKQCLYFLRGNCN